MTTLLRADPLAHPDLCRRAESAARSIVYGEAFGWLALELAEVTQEAYLALAGEAELAYSCLAGEDGANLGTLTHRIYSRLSDRYRVTARRASRTPMVSAEWRYDSHNECEGYGAPVVAPSTPEPVSTYSTDLVRALLPVVWDGAYCWGMQAEVAVDRDLPRGQRNPATSHTFAAMRADLCTAWAVTDLDLHERQALVLVVGLDLLQDDAAELLAVSQPTVSRWVSSGIEKLTKRINALGGCTAPHISTDPHESAGLGRNGGKRATRPRAPRPRHQHRSHRDPFPRREPGASLPRRAA